MSFQNEFQEIRDSECPDCGIEPLFWKDLTEDKLVIDCGNCPFADVLEVTGRGCA